MAVNINLSFLITIFTTMNNIKSYKIGLIVMLLANVVLIFFIVQKPGKPPYPQERGDVRKKISHELKLNAEQEAAYFELAHEHRLRVKEVESKQRLLVKTYFELLKDSNPNPEEVTSSLQALQFMEAEKLATTYEHFEALKSLCNPAQQARFDLIIDEIISVLIGGGKRLSPPPRDR